MCIIVYKPQGTDFPEKKVLEQCFINNDDGAGFMYADGQNVHIRKGFMTFDKFYRALQDTIKKVGGRKLPYILHFRISTQAGVSPEFTHPYPLSDCLEDMKKLKCKSNIGIAHNGIIPLTSDFKSKKANDTMEFITDYLSLIIRNRNYYEDKKTLALIEKLVDSKLAILDGGGHCELIGDFIKEGETFYSNNTYLPYTYGNCIQKYSYSYEEEPYFENCYNEETGVYDFDMLDCPSLYGYEDMYCDVCKNYRKCYALN